MRILHIVTLVDDEGSHGGAFAVTVNQCIELRRRGHDARIAGGWRGSGPAPTRLEGVPAHLFRVRPVAPGLGFSGLVSPALLRWVHHHATSFDIAHLHLARDLVPLSIAGLLQRLEVPYVVQAHRALTPGAGLLCRVLDHRMTRRALLSARHIFADTIDERDAIARVSGTSDNISLLRNGVVLPDRVLVTDDDGPADVLFLGRLAPGRRVMAFAGAAERLIADGVAARFTVVGPDGGDLKQLRRFIATRPHLHDRLRYEGALPHERALERLRRADLYVLPSIDGQAYPMSLLEAMAAGVPSICTTACGLAGILARERAAIVANPTDDAIYGAMRRILTDRAARARLSGRAAATAASAFSMTSVAEVLEEEYGIRRVDAAGAGRPACGPVPGSDRPQLTWVLGDPEQAHVEVWDAVRAAARLTVVLIDGAPSARTAAGPGGTAGSTALAGRGYPVQQAPGRGPRAAAAMRTVLRDAQPDVIIIDGVPPRVQATITRWAERARVRVVTSSGAAGPGAAAREALSTGGGRRCIDLDLRCADPGGGAATVIDLDRGSTDPGARRP
jgi:glycosyltransferase involved in cell wall biosynthesis